MRGVKRIHNPLNPPYLKREESITERLLTVAGCVICMIYLTLQIGRMWGKHEMRVNVGAGLALPSGELYAGAGDDTIQTLKETTER